jgi:sulfonate transport system permease protein
MSANDFSLVEAKPGGFIDRPTVKSFVPPKKQRRVVDRVRRLPDAFVKAALPVTLLLTWEIVTRLAWIDPLFLPTPLSVVKAFYELLVKDRLLLDLRVSGLTVLEGFSIGAGLGLLAGVAAGLSSTFEKLIGSLLNSIRQVPPLAFLPLIILWAGAGNTGKIVVISKAVFFPVFMNTLQGIRSVAREYIEVGKVFEYPPVRLLQKVILPAALPSIFVGVRYGAGLAWAMIIAAEMLGGRRGLGYLLTRANELLLTDQLFLVIFLIGLIGFAVDIGLRRLERRLLRWKRGFEG